MWPRFLALKSKYLFFQSETQNKIKKDYEQKKISKKKVDIKKI